MKKKLLSLSITVSLLSLTACGNSNDTSVSAMNDIATVEETTVAETTTAETGEEKGTIGETAAIKDEKDENKVIVDSTGSNTTFGEDEITGEDKAESTTENTTETVQKVPFTVDDFDLSDEDKEYLQVFIDAYEAGEISYLSLLNELPEIGIDNTEYIKEHDKSQGTGSSSSSTSPKVNYPENYNPADYGVPETPEQILDRDWSSHPELSDVHAY